MQKYLMLSLVAMSFAGLQSCDRPVPPPLTNQSEKPGIPTTNPPSSTVDQSEKPVIPPPPS